MNPLHRTKGWEMGPRGLYLKAAFFPASTRLFCRFYIIKRSVMLSPLGIITADTILYLGTVEKSDKPVLVFGIF